MRLQFTSHLRLCVTLVTLLFWATCQGECAIVSTLRLLGCLGRFEVGRTFLKCKQDSRSIWPFDPQPPPVSAHSSEH